MTRSSACAVLLFAALAWGHPKGFHKKVTVTVTPTRVSALVVMDIDSGDRALLLREPADSDRNGLLTGEERAALKRRLQALATQKLVVQVSGAPLPLVVQDCKLSLRDDPRADDGPLSVAVLLELELHTPFHDGLQLELSDVSPDTSTVIFQVFQPGAPPDERELPSGARFLVRLQGLADAGR